MKKARIYNFLILFSVISLISIPIVVQRPIKFMQIVSIGLFCLALAFDAERRITFRIIKSIEQLKWVNDVGLGPLHILADILSLLSIVGCIVWMAEDISQANIMSLSYMILMPGILNNQSVYIGKNYIYTLNTYINIEDITAIEKKEIKQGKHKNYTKFIIQTHKKAYTIKLSKNMHQAVETLDKIKTIQDIKTHDSNYK